MVSHQTVPCMELGFLHIYVGHGRQRSRAALASLLVPREIHFLGPSGRFWKGDPFIGGYGDATMEVMMLVGCGLTPTDINLGHHIHICVGAHGDAWWCVVECWIALWNRSVLHRIEYTWGVTSAMAQERHEIV